MSLAPKENRGFPALFDRLYAWWGGFQYNFAWPDYVWLLNSWLAKAALAVPILGYLVLFNDTVAQHVQFETLTSAAPRWGFLDGDFRLRLVYFGTLLLGAANFIYIVRRPYVMRHGESLEAYSRRALETYTLHDLDQMASRIERDNALTIGGKFSYQEWTAFKARAKGIGHDVVKAAAAGLGTLPKPDAAWETAKSEYGSMLRGVLGENYFRESRKRRGSLSLAISMGLGGLILLALPSFDLFLKVLSVIIWPAHQISQSAL